MLQFIKDNTKNIVVIVVIIVFAVLAITGKLSADNVMQVINSVLGTM